MSSAFDWQGNSQTGASLMHGLHELIKTKSKPITYFAKGRQINQQASKSKTLLKESAK